MTKNTNSVQDDGFNEVKPNNVTFTKVDDYIKGTYIERIDPTTPDKFGNKKPAYVIKIEEGIMHDSKTGLILPTEPGQFWKMFGGKAVIDNGMANIKQGQKVIVKLVELRSTDKGNDAKIMKVLAGPMDQVYLDEKAEDDKF